jgi:hypothetical protein
MRPHVLNVSLFDRREALKLGGLGAAGAALAACDVLDLPELLPVDEWPPVSANEDFYVQSAFGNPAAEPSTITLSVLDRGVPVGEITPEALEGLEARTIEHTLECIGARPPRLLLIDNALWGGLPVTEVFEELGIPIPEDALEMVFQCADDYHTSIPATDLHGTSADTSTDQPLWLVWTMNGEPLSKDHGAPFRFLTPGRYGTKNPKWPYELDFVDEPYTGHWEQRGWSQGATYRTNGMVLYPPSASVVGEGTVRILGSGFAGARQIVSIECTTDEGDSWRSADVQYQPGGHVWTLWSFDWTIDGPGTYYLQVRVMAEDGSESAEDPDGTDRLQGYDGGMLLELRVT